MDLQSWKKEKAYTEQLSSISATVVAETKWEAFNHSKRVCKKENLSLETDCSSPEKVREFLSRHKHHMRQWVAAFQIAPESVFPFIPDQHANNSSTPLGITQDIPNKVRTRFHSSWARGQCNSKWLTDSPLDLHIQHQSIMRTFLFRRLSIVRILPNVAVQEKKATLDGTLAFHTLLQGKEIRLGLSKAE